MAATAEPIYALLKYKKKWTWNKLEEESLRKIKETISRRKALAPFETRSERKVRLTCDACEEGMGPFWNKNKRTDRSCQCCIVISFPDIWAELHDLGKRSVSLCSCGRQAKKYLLGRIFLLRMDHRSLETLLSLGQPGICAYFLQNMQLKKV